MKAEWKRRQWSKPDHVEMLDRQPGFANTSSTSEATMSSKPYSRNRRRRMCECLCVCVGMCDVCDCTLS